MHNQQFQVPFKLGDLIRVQKELALIVQDPGALNTITKNSLGSNVITRLGVGFLAQVYELQCIIVVNKEIIASGEVEIISTLINENF